jgi:glucose-6-phosphate-specific signal transduction histidine kinase
MVWQRLSALAAMAAALTLAISVFSAVAIAQALAPARGIIAGLRRLSAGDYRGRVALGRARDFAPLGAAVNELADRLTLATSERIDLTRKLIEAREEERRDLARELHDEFGQCLAAGAAFAGAIEMSAARDRPDVVNDAREIGRLFRRMSSALRSALTRLRNWIAISAGIVEADRAPVP